MIDKKIKLPEPYDMKRKLTYQEQPWLNTDQFEAWTQIRNVIRTKWEYNAVAPAPTWNIVVSVWKSRYKIAVEKL